MLLAVWWSDLLIALGKDDIPRAVHVGIDWRVLGFTLGVSLLTGLIFGLAPAFHSSKTELVESLKEGGTRHAAKARDAIGCATCWSWASSRSPWCCWWALDC